MKAGLLFCWMRVAQRHDNSSEQDADGPSEDAALALQQTIFTLLGKNSCYVCCVAVIGLHPGPRGIKEQRALHFQLVLYFSRAEQCVTMPFVRCMCADAMRIYLMMPRFYAASYPYLGIRSKMVRRGMPVLGCFCCESRSASCGSLQLFLVPVQLRIAHERARQLRQITACWKKLYAGREVRLLPRILHPTLLLWRAQRRCDELMLPVTAGL